MLTFNTVALFVFRHVPHEHLGLIAPVLRSSGISFQYIDLFERQDSLIPWESSGGLISMGGPMSANDDFPYLHREMQIIEETMKRGLPVLGVCLGSQLIARVLGARVYRNPVKEIGWAPVSWTPEASRDPLFTGFQAPETIFHWHGETFDLPDGAVWLAHSEACRHQAYRYADNVYGLQFHLEVTPAMIQEWCREDAACGDRRELREPLDPHAHAARLEQLAEIVFGRWADLVQRADGACSG